MKTEILLFTQQSGYGQQKKTILKMDALRNSKTDYLEW